MDRANTRKRSSGGNSKFARRSLSMNFVRSALLRGGRSVITANFRRYQPKSQVSASRCSGGAYTTSTVGLSRQGLSEQIEGRCIQKFVTWTAISVFWVVLWFWDGATGIRSQCCLG
jgi:hypothetical protein